MELIHAIPCPLDIFGWRDGFQMFWAHTSPIKTCVIYFVTLGDRTNPHLICHPMRIKNMTPTVG